MRTSLVKAIALGHLACYYARARAYARHFVHEHRRDLVHSYSGLRTKTDLPPSSLKIKIKSSVPKPLQSTPLHCMLWQCTHMHV